MPYPDIDPVLISLGPLPIRWYALAYIAGIALGAVYVTRLIARPGLWGPGGRSPLDRAQLDDFVTWIILGVILGGRLGFLVFYRPELILQMTTLFGLPFPAALAVWEGGMSFHGGMIGVAVATYLFARKRGAPFFGITDLLACAAPIGLFFGRLANFINAELYGRPTDAPWGIVFPDHYSAAQDRWIYAADAVPRHPSQLYEAALEGLVLFLIIRIAITRFDALRAPGAATGLFLIGYGASRFFVEFFREPDVYAATLGFLTRGMLLSLPMAALGLLLLLRGRRLAHRVTV
ncbi:prolipoprotein diacylglyceryl transferase [Parvularcula dongshanensis]|uniref:Phosphatidylglycerol--prolipoprotein diacylglyceryl transferase n=1 Tax=Parvularcula dongshanensis TaxID=1173995 RepID=A0A840I4V2_9PROT|nr:prolipoprotein diacylglyceryl transferase [Parvularcula dongshanensis]MBB4659311.1 phosphatidylglycerol:prolipoprotein diacylglycerol transferase [Parvularcula dongshanensis]